MGVFDDLNPDMFHVAGSEVIEEPAPECGFLDSIEQDLVMLRAQYAATEGAPNPVAFLASRDRLAGFLARDGESIEGSIDRLVLEAARMGAVRLFFFRRTQVAAVPSAPSGPSG